MHPQAKLCLFSATSWKGRLSFNLPLDHRASIFFGSPFITDPFAGSANASGEGERCNGANASGEPSLEKGPFSANGANRVKLTINELPYRCSPGAARFAALFAPCYDNFF
jgi:hypothetical protein